MVDDAQFKTAKAIRGTESRSIAKWQKDGWELVDQTAGTLHTTLNFRRIKPKVPWLPIAALGGVVLLVAVIGGIVSAIQGDDETVPASSKPAAAATEEPSEPSQPSETPKPAASEPSEPEVEQVLTRENNEELAAVLAVSDGCDETLEAFAGKYRGRTIEFDGSVALMANHGDFKTRYDYLISPGDQGPESTGGPNFKFEDVNFLDLHLTAESGRSAIFLSDLVHVVARVEEYNPTQCLFFLDPISTGIR